jgi:uncharacterized protein YgiM (DUF1202 family)
VTYKELNEKCTVITEMTEITVYATADSNAESLGTLKNGNEVTRLGTYSNGWSAITYNDMTAYVLTEYLVVTDNEESIPTIYVPEVEDIEVNE